MRIESFYVKESQLDIQQRAVLIKKLAQNLVVTGGAGSGKSILALLKAKAMLNNNDNVLYVVKTVALNSYMDAGVSLEAEKEREQAPSTSSNTRIWGRLRNSICSYNHCFRWIKDDNGDFQNLGWKKGEYDYIILDEATDLKMPEIQVLISHCKYFVAFGDDDQQLYKFNNTSTKVIQIANVLGIAKPDSLAYNHRLPKKIARLIVYIHPNPKIIPGNLEADVFIKRCIVEGREIPHIFKYASEDEQFDDIIKIVNNKDGGLKSVGILFRDIASMKRAYEYFKTKGRHCSMVIDSKTTGEAFDSDAPNLMTYHEAKGLQFETVFIPNCSDPGYDRVPIYVAMTRTYSYLYIMYTGIRPSFINNIDPALYETNSGESQHKFSFEYRKTNTNEKEESPF